MPMSADLGEVLETYVNALVKSGRYHSKSEVLREGVRLLQEREARLAELHMKLAEGIAAADGGELFPADEVFSELRANMAPAKTKPRNAG